MAVSDSFRVGGADAPDWAVFLDVRNAVFGPAGALWLADTRGARLLRVDPGGRSGHQVGRKGGGPGEYQAPLLLAVTGEGRVLLSDVVGRSLQFFAADGRFERSVSGAGRMGTPAALAWLRGDLFFSYPQVYRLNNEAVISTADGMQPVHEIPLLRIAMDSAGIGVTRIGTARFDAAPRPAGMDPFTPHAFGTRLLWSVAGDRIAIVDGEAYEVRVLDESGHALQRLTRPLEPRKPTRADVEAARAEARARLMTPDGKPRIAGASSNGNAARVQETRQRIERALSAMTVSDRIPVLQAIRFDGEGRLWVARTGRVWGEPGPVDVFGADGRYLGTIARKLERLPDAFGPGGLAAWIEKDDQDVQYVQVRRITLH